MKRLSASEKLLIEEIAEAGSRLFSAMRGLSVGRLISLIRKQLGMSQENLARIAGIPQSTISRIERGQIKPSPSNLAKISEAIACDIVFAVVPRESIDAIRRRQARRIAEKRIRYLKGTMSLEMQEPDRRWTEEMIKQEEDNLLRSSNLWDE